jgi:hypothetical protein
LLDDKFILSSEKWINVEKYVEILDKYYLNKFGHKYDIDKISIQQEFEQKLIIAFPNLKILYNSEKQPPYDYSEGWNTAKYEINMHLIVFRLSDWRDFSQYDVTVDSIGGYLIDTFTNYKYRIKEIIKDIKIKCS